MSLFAILYILTNFAFFLNFSENQTYSLYIANTSSSNNTKITFWNVLNITNAVY